MGRPLMTRRDLADQGGWWSWGERMEQAMFDASPPPEPVVELTPEQQIAADESEADDA